jgi:hypothetical protein
MAVLDRLHPAQPGNRMEKADYVLEHKLQML